MASLRSKHFVAHGCQLSARQHRPSLVAPEQGAYHASFLKQARSTAPSS